MIFWGFNVSAIKVLVMNIDPILLTAFRIFLAGFAVIITCIIIGIFRLPSKKEWMIIFYIALFNVVLHHILIAVGLRNTSGVNTSLILGTGPLLTMVLAILLLGRRVSKWRLLGFIIGFIGIIITSSSGLGFTGISFGDLMIFLGVLVQAFSFILISKLDADFDPRLITGYMLLVGSIFIFLTSLVFQNDVMQLSSLFSWKLGFVFLFSALLCTAFGHMSYNYAIKKVGPAESAIFINLNTLFAVIGSVIFLNEVITLYHGIGFLLILCGVFFGTGSIEYMIQERRAKRSR